MSNRQQDKEIADTVNKANNKLAAFFSNKDSQSNKNWDNLEHHRKQWADSTAPKQPLVSAPPNPTKSGNDLDDLEKLAELYKKGIITSDEFAKKKKQILGI